MEREKIKAVIEWKEPRKIKELQAFLGIANFYRQFVQNFSAIAKPLTRLTGKDVPWTWGEEEQKAFDGVKHEITKDPVLIHPNQNLPYVLETDTPRVGMGAVLSQKQADGHLHPIAFMSQSFNNAQQNYDTHNKELLAIIESFKHWQLLLELTEEPITVYTNHRNLKSWKLQKSLADNMQDGIRLLCLSTSTLSIERERYPTNKMPFPGDTIIQIS